MWVTHPCQTCEGPPAPPAHPSHRTRTGSDLPPELPKDGEEGRAPPRGGGGACTNHTLSFVDVRSTAYNKNPDNNNEGDTSTTSYSGIVLGCVDPQSHTHKRQPTAQSSCNSCVINREQAEGAVGMALITRTHSAPANAKSQRREVIGHGPVL